MYSHKDDINFICELLAVKHGDLELDLFSNSVLDVFIEFLCTNYFCANSTSTSQFRQSVFMAAYRRG